MAEERPSEAALALVWSLWSELGVPGPQRRHRRAIVDPERLIVVTPWLARGDARLSDLVFSWCVQHAQRISGSRLAALVLEAPPDVRLAAEAFLAELSGAGVRWVRVPPPPAARPRESRTLDVALERPALLRLRMRALAGVGGRADVLVALLAAPGVWTSAAQLGEVGLAKRNVARVLAELAEAGIASARRRGNVREFRLARPGMLGELVGLPRDAVFPDWRAVFDWIYLADELTRLPADRPATRRVEVARRREALVALAAELGFGRPGGEDADSVVGWASAHARAIADGTAPGVGGPADEALPLAGEP